MSKENFKNALYYLAKQKDYFIVYSQVEALKNIEDNSLISVRGKGRAIIVNIGDITKKGRIKVKAKLII